MRYLSLLVLLSLIFTQCSKDEAEVTVDFLIDGEDIEASADKVNAPNHLQNPEFFKYIPMNETFELECTTVPQEALEERQWTIDHSIVTQQDRVIEYLFEDKGPKPITMTFNGVPVTKWVYVYDIEEGDPRQGFIAVDDNKEVQEQENTQKSGNNPSENKPSSSSDSRTETKKSNPLVPQVKKQNESIAQKQKEAYAQKETKPSRNTNTVKSSEKIQSNPIREESRKEVESKPIVKNTSEKPKEKPKEKPTAVNTSKKTSTTTKKINSVDFTLSKSSALVGDILTFTDRSAPIGAIDRRVWEFGDGNSKVTSSASVSHSYKQAGSYSVSVCINGDPNNCTSKMVKINPLPVAEKKVLETKKSGPFKCNIKGIAGVSSKNICTTKGQEEWIQNASLKLSPRKRLELLEAKVNAQKAGSIVFELYEDGSKIGDITSFVNPGMNQVLLDEFYTHLEPESDYTLKIVCQNDQRIENINACDPQQGSQQHIKINYQNNIVLFNLKYCYQ